MGGGRWHYDEHSEDIYNNTRRTKFHHHTKERTLGLAGNASGTTHVAAGVGKANGTTFTEDPFVLTTASDDWSDNPTLLLGSAETFWDSDTVRFDLHRFYPVAASHDRKLRFLRISWGTGTAAQSITAGAYTVQPIFIDDTNKRSAPIELDVPDLAIGTFVWGHLFEPDQNDRTMSIFPVLHQYYF